MTAELRVVATAGHVDHGKSSLIVRLTGMDPDRFAEEKRRGLTIDLGYAWCSLPSGREVGFVDVPGHERFIRNMLAGVGPVRLVLFVVAADEGWKPQSEEHLAILDVLGIQGGVIALTKRDLVDAAALEAAAHDVRARTEGTALAGAPVVSVSSVTGEGLDELRVALDSMLGAATPPEVARPRLFIDRVFSIKGAGTVVTGTLGGDCLAVGDEVELYPTGRRARIRSLQTHKKPESRACPVSRVAANLVGADRGELERGDVLGRAGTWRATRQLEAALRPVRGLSHPITTKGAYKLYAGAAEADARLRIYDASKLEPGGRAYVHIRLCRPLILDVFDRFVLREAGRRETVGGGVVLDVAPPARRGSAPEKRLDRRAGAAREELPGILVAERGAVADAEAALVTGSKARGGLEVGGWLVAPETSASVEHAVLESLTAFHRDHPLEEGAAAPAMREMVSDALTRDGVAVAPGLVDALLDDLVARGVVARSAATMRLVTHSVTLGGRTEDVERLLSAVGGEREASPPSVDELIASGIGRDVIEAAARAGVVVRVSPALVVAPSLVERATRVIRDAGPGGVTVSAFREALGTSRKYAVPLLEWFDRQGVTRRSGDLRVLRGGG